MTHWIHPPPPTVYYIIFNLVVCKGKNKKIKVLESLWLLGDVGRWILFSLDRVVSPLSSDSW